MEGFRKGHKYIAPRAKVIEYGRENYFDRPMSESDESYINTYCDMEFVAMQDGICTAMIGRDGCRHYVLDEECEEVID